MDSLTQIVLGAACGEVVAGKKLGNRAMLWGAIGGTIPDLDVFAQMFTDEITATSFHRGFMHSFVFAVLAPFLLAKMTQWFYHGGVYRKQGYKLPAMVLWVLFYVGAAAGVNFIPVLLGEGLSWYVFVPTLLLGIALVVSLWKNYLNRDLSLVEAPYRTWVMLFFWSIFTHPILDCFTSWGTQIWQPFADTRVQWTTVSVVDPLYTVPFALCLIVAAFLLRTNKARVWWSWAGILWGCAYLGYTVWHKRSMGLVFKDSLREKNIAYTRFYTGPTIFNNIVWSGVAEGDTAYYFGLYGFNDPEKRMKTISVIPKNHQLLDHIPPDDRTRKFLSWFTDGYYNVVPYRGDTLQVNDLRFGLLGDRLRGNNYVFPFLLFKNEKGVWDIKQNNRNKESVEDSERSFSELWARVKGHVPE